MEVIFHWISLNDPLTDMTRARQLLRALAKATGGDRLSPAQSLRLPATRNTKPHRKEVLCRVIHQHDRTMPVADFTYLLPSKRTLRQHHTSQVNRSGRYTLSPENLQAVTNTFLRLGYRQSGDWLSGPCIYPENHRHNDAHPSFGFNIRTGYGNCFRCGSMLLKDICTELGIQFARTYHS